MLATRVVEATCNRSKDTGGSPFRRVHVAPNVLAAAIGGSDLTEEPRSTVFVMPFKAIINHDTVEVMARLCDSACPRTTRRTGRHSAGQEHRAREQCRAAPDLPPDWLANPFGPLKDAVHVAHVPANCSGDGQPQPEHPERDHALVLVSRTSGPRAAVVPIRYGYREHD